jgi:hypothetical protein
MAKAKATESATVPAPTRFIVSLKDIPSHVVEADDEAGAIEAYKAWAGIISTDHQYSVVPAGD